jgi:hypothetical protein
MEKQKNHLPVENHPLPNLVNQAFPSMDALRDVLDSIEAIVYIADLKSYEVLFANKYLKEAMGVQVGQLCYESIQKSPSGPCGFCPNNKLLEEDGSPGAAYRWEQLNTVDKRWYDTIDRAITWTDGRLVRLSIATDITDRKKMEESLQETNEKLNTLLKNSPDVIQVIDDRFHIVYTNEIMKETNSKSILGTSILSAMQEIYQPKFKEAFQSVVDSQQAISFEYEGIKGRWWSRKLPRFLPMWSPTV